MSRNSFFIENLCGLDRSIHEICCRDVKTEPGMFEAVLRKLATVHAATCHWKGSLLMAAKRLVIGVWE
jgi:hypothetical protein